MQKHTKTYLFLSISLSICLLVLYNYPLLLGINPFYTRKPYLSDYLSEDEYVRYSLISEIESDMPLGWKIKTQNYIISGSEEIRGLAGIDIYKEKVLVCQISAVTDTGGIGGKYYNFPDSNPSISERMRENSELISFIQVGEEEYSNLNIFNTEARRVEYNIVPNIDEDGRYFTNPLDPVLFYFDNHGPSFEVYYSNTKAEEYESKYQISLDEELKEEDLLLVDKILSSIKLK